MVFKEPEIFKRWAELEAPLKEIDSHLRLICAKYHFTFERNYQNWPSRALQWRSDNLQRKLEISLEPNMQTYRTIGYVYKDEAGRRFIKKLHLAQGISPPLETIVIRNMENWVDSVNLVKDKDLSESVMTKWKISFHREK